MAHALDGIELTPQELQVCETELRLLDALKTKLERNRLSIAVFGLVGQGKSATINALVGKPAVATGAAHGTTHSATSLQWAVRVRSAPAKASSQSTPRDSCPPSNGKTATELLHLELLDTPGINDVDGETREQLAFDVARRADLILFVISGDMTDCETQALKQLRQLQKPIVLAFNKIDLYPDRDRQTLYEQLTQPELRQLISPDEIVLVSAAPKPEEVRVEAEDGSVTTLWEEQSPEISALKKRLVQLVKREGQALIALNILRSVDEVRDRLIEKKLHLQEDKISETIWKFVGFKSLAIFANPFVLLDILGGIAIDIGLVTTLARQYGIAMSRYGARDLIRKLALSWVGLIAVELSTSLMLGLGKTAALGAAIASGGSSLASSFPAYSTAGIAQASTAGLTSYLIGQAVREYLKASCNENPISPKQAMKSVLSRLDKGSILQRIRQEVSDNLGLDKLSPPNSAFPPSLSQISKRGARATPTSPAPPATD